MTAIDVSNYTSPLTPQALAAAELVIVQTLDPPPGYPAGQTRAQLNACQEAGVPVDIYYLLFAGQTDAQIQHHLRLADGFKIRKKWLDLEEPGLSVRYIDHVLGLMDAYPATFPTTGIYSALWWNSQNPGVLGHFSATRQLWVAQYSSSPPILFAGWTEWRIWQYQDTTTWNGVANVDLNSLSAAELADLPPKGGNTVIQVGQGMQAQMAAAGDAPLCDHVFYTQTDEQGITFQVEKCYGSKGLYISSNSSGQWVNAGPI